MNPHSVRVCLVYFVHIHRWIDVAFNGSNAGNALLPSSAAAGGGGGVGIVLFGRVKAVNNTAHMGMCRLVVLECLAVAYEHIHENAVDVLRLCFRRLEVVWHGRKLFH